MPEKQILVLLVYNGVGSSIFLKIGLDLFFSKMLKIATL
jgi:hypothetical protein